MKQEEKIKNCRYMLHSLLKVRSNEIEQLNGASERVRSLILNDLVPWTGGEKGKATINALQKVIDRGTITGMEFFIFMTLAHRFDNGIIAEWLFITNQIKLPEPDISMITEADDGL